MSSTHRRIFAAILSGTAAQASAEAESRTGPPLCIGNRPGALETTTEPSVAHAETAQYGLTHK